jgi:hypothetical protein
MIVGKARDEAVESDEFRQKRFHDGLQSAKAKLVRRNSDPGFSG